MFDYSTITPDSQIFLDFERKSKTEIVANSKESGVEIGIISIYDDDWVFPDDTVKEQYNLWVGRPERKIGQITNINGQPLDKLMSMYEELLIGAYLKNHPDEKAEDLNFAPMIDWLRSTDFYTAPASTQYHESMPGGLMIHSLKVYNNILLLRQAYQFRKVPIAEAALVALVHDWCKISTYENYKRNVKNEKTGEWEKVDSYKRNFTGFTLGHGVTSMWYASKYFDLTEEQAAAIRWHMGKWNCCEVEVNELQRCNEIYPLVHLLQFADQLSITDYKED